MVSEEVHLLSPLLVIYKHMQISTGFIVLEQNYHTVGKFSRYSITVFPKITFSELHEDIITQGRDHCASQTHWPGFV